ncbi:MAG: PfkB family carbohydrate kinase [Angustibacter sp.]
MRRVLVVGDTVLDRDVLGDVHRVCPDAPAPVVDVDQVRDRPGGAGLAALLVVRPGVRVTLATGLGVDATGQRVRDLLRERVDLHLVLQGPTTPGRTRVRARGQSLLRLDDLGHLLTWPPREPELTDGDAPDVDAAALERQVRSCDVVLVADYGGEVTRHPVVREVLRRNASRVPVVWDPHPRGLAPVPGATVVTPNRTEAQRFLDPAVGVEDLAATLRRRWQAVAVAVTDGADGAVLSTAIAEDRTGAPGDPTRLGDRDHQTRRYRSVSCSPSVDTCGAGDRFAGAVAVALATGSAVPDAVESAVHDAASWLSDGGVQALDLAVSAAAPPPHPAPDVPVTRALTTHSSLTSHARLTSRARLTTPSPRTGQSPRPESSSGVLPRFEPEGDAPGPAVVQRVRANGGTVVATGGCFDVLHPGHLALVEQARRLGDCLVVLVNSDASVRRLKGPGRPAHSQDDRAALLRALRPVDAVVVFDEDDPRAALTALRPHVWVKGGDYRVGDLPEAEVVAGYGGRVHLVPVLPGHSTTGLLHRPRPRTAAG